MYSASKGALFSQDVAPFAERYCRDHLTNDLTIIITHQKIACTLKTNILHYLKERAIVFPAIIYITVPISILVGWLTDQGTTDQPAGNVTEITPPGKKPMIHDHVSKATESISQVSSFQCSAYVCSSLRFL